MIYKRIRGIRFNIPNEYGDFLKRIFDTIDLKDYFIFSDVSNEEILDKGAINISLSTITTGKEFMNFISNRKCYIISLRIMMSKINKIDFNITTYQDFLNSTCELIILCTDSTYYDIYCKDLVLLDEIIFNVKKYNFSNFIIITDENDKRTKLCAF